MNRTLYLFAVLLTSLFALFGAGWFTLSLGVRNPVPWAIQSAWGDMISVGMAVEQATGYVPSDGRSLVHAAIVVGSASVLWALVLTAITAIIALGARAYRYFIDRMCSAN